MLAAQKLAGKVLCSRCAATFATFDEVCIADLDDPCPGFEAIDVAMRAAEKQLGLPS